MKGRLVLVLAGLAVLAGCGGSSKQASTGALAGNWQFTLQKSTNPRTATLLSGFLQQTAKTVTGAVELTPPLSSTPTCGGAFQVTGTNDGQNVTLTVNEGGATVSLTGTSSASAMGGTYSLVAAGCGKDESGTWTATLVQPVTGNFQGILHSTDGNTNANPLLKGSDFAITGQILQGDNVGATSATLTGTVSAVTTAPNVDYPCFADATLSGSITGTQVQIEVIGSKGTVIGTIGSATASANAVRVKPDGSGFLNLAGAGYFMNKASGCASSETGNICVNLGSATTCKQPVAFSQDVVAFNPMLVGTSSSAQTITITNQSATDIDLASFEAGVQGTNSSDYAVDFSACPVSPVTLAAGTSCSVSVVFTPTASCLPFNPPGFAPTPVATPLTCPLPRTAALSLSTSDADSPHVVQLTGIGLDPVVPDVADLNFGVVPAKTIGAPLTVTFTNQGPNHVTIQSLTTGGPANDGSTAFVQCGSATSTIQGCDFVTKSQVTPANDCTPPPTLQDSCTGQAISAGGSCKVDVVFCPVNAGVRVEYMQIVTDEHDASGAPTADSTRVPVELDGTAN